MRGVGPPTGESCVGAKICYCLARQLLCFLDGEWRWRLWASSSTSYRWVISIIIAIGDGLLVDIDPASSLGGASTVARLREVLLEDLAQVHPGDTRPLVYPYTL